MADGLARDVPVRAAWRARTHLLAGLGPSWNGVGDLGRYKQACSVSLWQRMHAFLVKLMGVVLTQQQGTSACTVKDILRVLKVGFFSKPWVGAGRRATCAARQHSLPWRVSFSMAV